MKRLTLILPLLLLMACQKQVVLHPGAIDQLDSQTYDTLLIAQSVIDNAKVAYLQGTLPGLTKDVLNSAGQSYNLLRDLWILYRAAPNQDTAKLIAEKSLQLSAFIAQLRGVGVK